MTTPQTSKSNSARTDRDATRAGSNRKIEPLALYVLLGTLVVLVLRTAWLADDAFITLRTLDNWVHGAGLRYNLLERVQAYTHPLWLAVLAPVYALTKAPFISTISVSVVCSTVAAWMLAFRVAKSSWHALLALALLILSSTFVDYSTSGLENPLTHLLVVAFVASYLGLWRDGYRENSSLLLIALLASLLILNRHDLALLILPALIVAVVRKDRATEGQAAIENSSRSKWGQVALGLLPIGLWQLFSIVYYGFPFPNTAYAKLATGIPRSELIEQGLYYLQDSLLRNPLTLLVIALAISIALIKRQPRQTALAAGAILYLLYIIWIGGDFMSGRFLSVLYCLSIAILATTSMSRKTMGVMTLAALFLVSIRPSEAPTRSASGITDERPFYESLMGLPNLYPGHRIERNQPDWKNLPSRTSRTTVRVRGAIGVLGFTDGPSVHLVDVMGLTDPLLARLPASNHNDWRIGHFERKLPDGYLATLTTGQDSIESAQLSEYYQHLKRITRGRLFTQQRWASIWAVNTGGLDHLIDRKSAAKPYHRVVPIEAVSEAKANGTSIDDSSNLPLAPREAVLIQLNQPSSCHSLEIGLFAGDRYRMAFYRGDKLLPWYKDQHRQRTDHGFGVIEGNGVQKNSFTVPKDVTEAGYDGLLIRAGGSDPSITPGIGYIQLCETP